MIFKKMLSIAAAAIMCGVSLTATAFAEGNEPDAADGTILSTSEGGSETGTDTDAEADETAGQEYVYDNSYTDYVMGDSVSVFDLIRIKRDIINSGGLYNRGQLNIISDFLIKLSDGVSKRYAKNVVISFDTQGLPRDSYRDPSVLDPVIVSAGSSFTKIPVSALVKENSLHNGWDYNGITYKQGQSFPVPYENVTFTPHWFNYHLLTYNAGDYDDIVGIKTTTVQVTEGTNFDLADSTRFSRKGYSIVGWECSLDGKVYGINSKYIIPESDVVFNAVWKAAMVDISLSANNGNVVDKIADKAETGSEYILPDCTFENGDKTFIGWKYDGNIYQPGESFTVPALLKGAKVVVTAQWQ